jgi:hypothetical protein
LLVVASIVLTGCLTSFKHPLGPVDEGFIEERLCGTWSCSSADDPTPATVAIFEFDSTQYYIETVEHGKNDRTRSRAHATRIGDVAFLNVHELGQDQGGWTLVEYRLAEPDRLTLQHVDPEAFEDVIDDAAAVKDRLASLLLDPQVVEDLLLCTRSKAP